MSYLNDAVAYNGDVEEGSNASSGSERHAYLDQVNTELYSPYSADEALSTQFFKASSDSISSSGSHSVERPEFAGDPYVRARLRHCAFPTLFTPTFCYSGTDFAHILPIKVWNNRFQEAIAAVRQLEVETVSHRTRIKTWLKMSSVSSVRGTFLNECP